MYQTGLLPLALQPRVIIATSVVMLFISFFSSLLPLPGWLLHRNAHAWLWVDGLQERKRRFLLHRCRKREPCFLWLEVPVVCYFLARLCYFRTTWASPYLSVAAQCHSTGLWGWQGDSHPPAKRGKDNTAECNRHHQRRISPDQMPTRRHLHQNGCNGAWHGFTLSTLEVQDIENMHAIIEKSFTHTTVQRQPTSNQTNSSTRTMQRQPTDHQAVSSTRTGC